MPTTFRPYEPDQLLLLAPDMHEWLPEGHLAHHVSDLVDEPDLTVFCRMRATVGAMRLTSPG